MIPRLALQYSVFLRYSLIPSTLAQTPRNPANVCKDDLLAGHGGADL